MNEIEYTLKVKVNTDAPLSEFTVKAIAKAMVSGAEDNIDEGSVMEVSEMNATFLTPTTVNCFGADEVEEEVTNGLSFND